MPQDIVTELDGTNVLDEHREAHLMINDEQDLEKKPLAKKGTTEKWQQRTEPFPWDFVWAERKKVEWKGKTIRLYPAEHTCGSDRRQGEHSSDSE